MQITKTQKALTAGIVGLIVLGHTLAWLIIPGAIVVCIIVGYLDRGPRTKVTHAQPAVPVQNDQWEYLYRDPSPAAAPSPSPRQPRQDVPSYETVMGEWDRLHGGTKPEAAKPVAPTTATPRPKSKSSSARAKKNGWVSSQLLGAQCVAGEHSIVPGGCSDSQCQCQCHLGRAWQDQNHYKSPALPDEPPY